MSRTDHRPSLQIAWLVGLLGEVDARRVIEAHGGVRIYVPYSGDLSALVETVGYRAAGLLAREIGGNFLKIPLAKRWRVEIMRRDGLTIRDIARAVLVDESTVSKWLADAGLTRPGAPPTQPKLPGF